MNYGITAEFVSGAEHTSLGDGEPAFRCGQSLPLADWPIRGADLHPLASTARGDRIVIAINWARDVVWQKRIRTRRSLRL
jgi:hypothetical protein